MLQPRQRRRRIAGGLLAALGVLLAPSAGADGVERWVDEAGNVHYGDAPPPSAVQASPEAARDEDGAGDTGGDGADAAAQGTATDTQAEAPSQAERDRMLLQSYTTLASLERTRDRRLGGIDSRIGLAEHRLRNAKARVADLEQELAQLASAADRRAKVERALAQARQRRANDRALLDKLRRQRARMAERFARDIARFRELKASAGNESP
jgi:hypothetical protein